MHRNDLDKDGRRKAGRGPPTATFPWARHPDRSASPAHSHPMVTNWGCLTDAMGMATPGCTYWIWGMGAYPDVVGAAIIAGALVMYGATGGAAAMGSATAVWAMSGVINGAVTSGTAFSCKGTASISSVFLREEVVFFFFEDFFFLPLPSPQEPYITTAPTPRSPTMMSRMPHQGKPPASSSKSGSIAVPFVPLVPLPVSGTGANVTGVSVVAGASVAAGVSVVTGDAVGRGVVAFSGGHSCGPDTTRPTTDVSTAVCVALSPTTQQPPLPMPKEKLPCAFHTKCRQ
mmetsp:Transcript_43857/g.135851  ORF Transcript_43857/g.135851 Transcript_43857/m.135851 type:complete len:287 (-) Transcript_43857:318-1178(-)